MFIIRVELSQIERDIDICVTDEIDLIYMLQILEYSEDVTSYHVISNEGSIKGPDKLNYVYDGLTFEKWR